mmetsp:Transcript_52004/g.121781  ORF Transcript_52004/g.121781 Transcript_52004/m.121781 type:complete len:108 (-) Transcript_52004:98-421(-)
MASRSALLPFVLAMCAIVWVSRTFVPMGIATAETSLVALRGSVDMTASAVQSAQVVTDSSIAIAAADPLWWVPITLGLGVFAFITTFGLFWFLTDGFDPERRQSGQR